MSKGSTWRIWDFHLHTPYSVLNNQFGDPENEKTWDKYISKIEEISEEKNFAGIGITDYFTVEGYKKVLIYKEQGRLNNILLFPNIEFRVDKVVYRSKNNTNPKRINFHVVFSPDCTPVEIEDRFLHDLTFIHENETFGSTKTRKLKISELIEFGRDLQKQHSRFADRSPFEIGCLTAIVQSDKIKELLENQFKGNYLLLLAEEDLDLMDWDGQDHGIRKHLIQMSHGIFSSNEKTRDFYLGKKHIDVKSYLNEFKSFKPCLWGCDSHGFDERFLKPDKDRYCWIKGEPTWEGLRQILFEPEGRVKIQESNPEPDKSIYIIDQVEISETKINDNLSINGFDLSLNPNLVAIIGGRGSGKTALLDLIARCFQEGNKLKEQKNSFYSRLYIGDKSQKQPTNKTIDLHMIFKSGDSFETEFGRDENYFEKSDIHYLTQNHFEEYTANPDKLNNSIINLVFERFKDEKRKYDDMEADIQGYENKIKTINLEIDTLNQEINGQIESENRNLLIKKGEYDDYSQRVSTIETNKGQADSLIVSLTSQLVTLKNRKRSLESILYNLNRLLEDQKSYSERYSEYVSLINEDLTALGDDINTTLLSENMLDFNSVNEVIVHNNSVLKQNEEETDSKIHSINEQIDELEGDNRIIAELQQKVNDISEEINDINNRISELKAKELRINNLINERVNIYIEIMRKTIDMRVFLQKIIEKFETGKDVILNNLKFRACIDLINKDEFINNLTDKIDNRMHSEEYLISEFEEIFNPMTTLLNTDDPKDDLEAIAYSINKLAQDLHLKKSTAYSDFNNFVFKKCYKIGLEIHFNNKPLNDLSMGERAIVLLKILLAQDDKPLLIDQPEEHLDNRYIYKELTPAFRSAKTRRQIIIATHNANLVVNTDAEQVIVAEHTNGTLSYKMGTLEDLGVRESIKSILEGGDEAFKKREEKYGYII